MDLNAAIGQLAALLGMLGGVTLKDADTMVLPNVDGMYLLAVRGCDETAGGTGGYLHFPGLIGDRKLRFGKDAVIGDRLLWEILFPPGRFPLAPGQKIKCYGNISGAGAEQHVVLLDIWMPNLADIPTVAPTTPMGMGIVKLGLKTGALTVQTPSGLASVLGDETAFEDSEIEFGTSKDNEYALLSIGNYPGGAGYGICGVRAPDGLSDRLFPAIFASAIKGYDFDLGWLIRGDAPAKLLGAGVGTTSTEWTLTLGQIK